MDHSSFGEYSVCSGAGGAGSAGRSCSRTPKRMIPQEPMSLVMNTAIGTWNGGQTALDGQHWPAELFVDYVRVWQKEGEENVGCDPPDFPTRTYIRNHAGFYGEPAKPSGYDTCPEVYPASAHANADAIEARAKAKRAAATSSA